MGQIGQMIRLVSTLHSLNQLKDETTHLQTSTERLRAPLLAALRATLQQGRVELENVGQPGQGSAQPAGGDRATGSGGNEPASLRIDSDAERKRDRIRKLPSERQRAMTELVQAFQAAL